MRLELMLVAFLDAIDGSYCTYSAYGETGDCADKACLDPVYPDPNPGGYKGQLQCGVFKPVSKISLHPPKSLLRLLPDECDFHLVWW